MLTPLQQQVLDRAAADGWQVLFSPYRACLVGAHVDHQGGKVTGFALSYGIVLAYSPTDDGMIRLEDLTVTGRASLNHANEPVELENAQDWSKFVMGAGKLLSPRKRGFEGVVAGSLPSGGLSSSAAFSLAILSALADANGRALTNLELSRAAVEIENRFVGVNCGLLDPTIITNAKAGHMVTLDCATGDVTVEPGPEVAIVAVYSGIPRALVSTGFNNRTEECRQAARMLSKLIGHQEEVTRLGELPRDLVLRHIDALPEPYCLRARHFVTETERVERATSAWRAGDLEELGRCASESLNSSIANYETGSEEQRVLARILRDTPAVLGARFCGGGFGGFAAGLCLPSDAQRIASDALGAYRRAVPGYADKAFAIVSQPSDSLRRLR